MNCEKAKKLVPDYLMGFLEPKAVKEVEEHISKCEDCKQALEQLKVVWEKLGELPREDPEPSLRGRFYAMLERTKQEGKVRERVSVSNRIESWISAWWPQKPAIQMGFSVVLLMFGVLIGSQFQAGSFRNGEMAQLREEIRNMRQIVSMSLLNQPSSSERIRGVGFTRQIDQPTETLLTTLLNTLDSDPNVNVRLAAVDALILFTDRSGVRDALIQSLSRQTSPLVQIALIDLLVQVQEKKALDALRSLIQDEKINPTVRAQAEKGIEALI